MSPMPFVAMIALPAAVAGDFDGDGRRDTARFVANGAGAARLEAVLAARPGVVWQIPGSAGPAANLYVVTVPPGRHAPLCDAGDGNTRPCSPPIAVATDAVAFGTKEASMAIAWWTGTGFKMIWTAD